MPRSVSSRRKVNRKNICVAVGTIVAVIFAIILSCYVLANESTSLPTLQLAVVIFRHGERTPTSFYPKDPYKDPKYWPDGFGALTKRGKQQMYKLGQFIRQKYNGFLSQKYSPEDVYMMSSDHDRCLMSGQLLFAGLYPPVGVQIWNKDIPWQPIPVHTVPRSLDKLIVVKKPCPKYDEELKEIYSSHFFENLDAAHSELYDYLTLHSGMPVNSLRSVEILFNTLEAEAKLNYELPAWTKDKYEEMKKLATLTLASFTFSNTTKRLKGGPLLKEVVNHMSQKASGLLKPSRKLYLYSSHDLTLISLLRALEFEELSKPEYGASIIFELHRAAHENEDVIKLYYLNNTEQTNYEKLRIGGCGEPCKLKDFLEITKPNIPTDWEAECKPKMLIP